MTTSTDKRNRSTISGTVEVDPLLEISASATDLKNAVASLGDMERIGFVPIDDGLVIAGGPARYSERQVEQLLGYAATLLDRCLSLRSEYEGKFEKALTTWLELTEFVKLDEVHADETAAGWYELDSAQAKAELAAQRALSKEAGEMIKLADGQFAQSGPSPFITAGESLITCNQINMEKLGSYLQQMVADQRIVGLGVRADYAAKNIEFRKRRTQIAREANSIKLLAFTSPGGALNFSEQMASLREIYQADFQNAVRAIAAVRPGLKLVYNYDMLDPGTRLDSAIVAVRNASVWLGVLVSKEQTYVITMSLKELVGDQWSAGFGAGSLSGQWSFAIPPERFPGQAFIRLRGLALTVDTAHSLPLWRARVRPPARGLFKYGPGAAQAQDQETQELAVGRVYPRSSIHSPETVGTTTFANLNPVSDIGVALGPGPGSWMVAVEPASNVGHSYITDVILHLVVATRRDDLAISSLNELGLS